MRITSMQLERYRREGFLVLEDFVDSESCESLRARAAELVSEFDPRGTVSIFSTAAQNHLRDDYFLDDTSRFYISTD